jgi:cyclase
MPRKRAAFGWFVAVCIAITSSVAAQSPTVGKVQQLAPDVYFYEGDIGKGHCNNGWVIFEDYVLVIDANFPSGAREVIARIRELTKKPIRFAFDTHHHGDHAYGNQVWVDQGATAVAHTGVLDEMSVSRPASSAVLPGDGRTPRRSARTCAPRS